MNKFALKRRILIVGEGRETEYNYFVGFRTAFEKELALRQFCGECDRYHKG